MRTLVDITGVDKAKLLAALYNGSHPLGMGFLHYDPQPMTEEHARELLGIMKSFDYLKGRVMKVDLTSDTELDTVLYNRDNGPGAAERIVEILRTTGEINNKELTAMHQLDTTISAIDARIMAKSKSQWSQDEDGTKVLRMGADELGPELDKAVDSALNKIEQNIKGDK